MLDNSLTRIQLKMNIMLGEATHPTHEPLARPFQPPAVRQRCYLHLQSATSKKEKDAVPNSKQICSKCGHICTELSKRVCSKCLEQ